MVAVAVVKDGALTVTVGATLSSVYVAVVAADLLPALSQAITATEVVVALIAMFPSETSVDPVPEEQSAGAVTEVPGAVA